MYRGATVYLSLLRRSFSRFAALIALQLCKLVKSNCGNCVNKTAGNVFLNT